jgi:serine/threonine protein kinase/Tol biopolymer transport system component
MTPERWQQIEELYHAALERPTAQRAAFLAEASACDPALRGEVEVLLAANERAGNFINEPALAHAAGWLTARSTATRVGQTLGHYEVLAQIGAGGMGEVFLARDTRLGRQVALKLLPPQFTQDAGRLQRFMREAKTASALNHPNIITIHEIGEWEQTFFIVTEYIAGVTLRQRLAERRLNLAEALNITQQIAAALEAAHAAGITHRDIKPENVMLRPDGLVKVLDFGLARFIERRKEDAQVQPSDQTDTGMVLGTPRYMSPEQARGLKTDARSDIFSLGVVLYEMVSGAPPFNGATSAEVFAALLEKEPPPLNRSLPQVAPKTGDELDAILAQALAKDPVERYQTIGELLADLAQLDEAGAVPAKAMKARQRLRRSSNTKDSSQRFARWRRQPAVLMLFGLAAVSLLSFLAFRLFRGEKPARPLLSSAALATMPGVKGNATFSPDGSQIAFVWDGGQKDINKGDIYIKLVGVGEPVQLTHTPEAEALPAWSPDGRYIAFLRGSGIYVIQALPGGTERKVGEGGRGVSWSPDSKLLAMVSVPATASAAQPAGPADPGSIFLLSVETGQRLRRITTPVAPASDRLPVFSPDGQYIAYHHLPNGANSELYVVPVTGGPPRQLTFDNRSISGLTWTTDSREIVYTANRGGGAGLWRLPVEGGAPERIPIAGQNPRDAVISRQGNRLAYTETYEDTNVYFSDGPGFAGQATPGKFGELKLLLASTRIDVSQQFSPDGEKIVFVSARTGSEEVWVCQRDGSQLVQLTHFDGSTVGSPRWSPDGRWIAFDAGSTGNHPEVYVISAADGAPRNFTNAASFDVMPSWSSDGRWLYFSSNRSGKRELWKQPVEDGSAVQVTRSGAFEGMEAPDGRIYFTKGRGVYGIWSMPVAGGAEAPVPELSQAGYWRSWGVLKEGLYFISKEAAPRQTIRFFSFATRRITPLLEVEKEALWYAGGLSLAPDGRRLLYTQMDHFVNDILLVENFR